MKKCKLRNFVFTFIDYNNGVQKNALLILSKHEIVQIQYTELSNDSMCCVLTLDEKYALG